MQMADFDGDEHPIAIQIYGRDPALMARAAGLVEQLGADILDLNMGCPSKQVVKKSGGSALMKEPERAKEIVAAMRAAVSIPFTVKMRAGWDQDSRNAPEMARMCEGEGVDAVAVHWRTRADNYGGERDLGMIRQVKEAVSIPVIANGDILDIEGARETLAQTGCDGLMIGRGAMRNPWVFLQVSQALAGEPVTVVDPREKERVLLHYFSAIRDTFGSDKHALGRFKKISNHFTRGLEGGMVLRTQILHSQSSEEAIERVQAFFASKEEMPASSQSRPAGTARPPSPLPSPS
jgi:nifR3 family TIM-barrel protein